MPKQLVLKLLREARKAATFETASFYPFDPDQDAKNAALRERTRIYRDTWILSPLDEAIKLLETR